MNRKLAAAGLLCLALAITTGARAQRDQKAEPTGPHPTIEVDEDWAKLGRVFAQDKYVHVFKVRNTGTADLVIDNVKPG
jgi:hypothetical protein